MQDAGCGMTVKMKARDGMIFNGVIRDQTILAGRDLLILINGMRDSFNIDGRMWGGKQKITTLQTLRSELRLYPGGIGINILSGTGWRACRIENSYVEPSCIQISVNGILIILRKSQDKILPKEN